MTPIRCEVLLFAALADAAKTSRLAIELAAEATVADVWPAIERSAPTAAGALSAWRRRTVIAVNERYVGPDTALRDGDRIALIPPVSGG